MKQIRYLIAIVICSILLIPSSLAQTRTFACEDTARYQQQIQLTMPDDAAAQAVVTVLSEDNLNPVVGLTLPDDNFTLCNVTSESALGYQVTVPDRPSVIANDTAAQTVSIGASEIEVGEFNNQRGVYWLVAESAFVEATEHRYTLNITQAMVDSGIAIEATLFAPDSMTQLSANGIPADAINAQLIAGFQENTQASQLVLPMAVGDAEWVINTDAPGSPYALVLRVATGVPSVADGAASVAQNEDDGAYQITCNDTVLASNGVRIALPDDGTLYQVTALGGAEYDPLLAIIDPNSDSGTCYNDTPQAAEYEVSLPTAIIGRNTNTAQATLIGTNQVVMGSVDDVGSDAVLLIDRANIGASDEVDSYRLQLNTRLSLAGGVITVYAVAADNQLDPELTLRDETGTILFIAEPEDATCDDVGVRSLCTGGADVGDLKGAVLQLADGRAVPLFATDAVVQLPMSADMRDGFIQMDVTGSEGTTGTYILVIHIVGQ